jgi:hypothetical protein
LWFLGLRLDKNFLAFRPNQEALNKGFARCLADWLQVDESQIDDTLDSLGRDSDSLDTVELVMEIGRLTIDGWGLRE